MHYRISGVTPEPNYIRFSGSWWVTGPETIVSCHQMSHCRWIMVRISAFVTAMLCTDFLGALHSQHTQISPDNPINCVQETHSNPRTAYWISFLRKIRRFCCVRSSTASSSSSPSSTSTTSLSLSPKFEFDYEFEYRVRVPSSSPEFEFDYELKSQIRVRVTSSSSSVTRDHWHHHSPTFESWWMNNHYLLQSATAPCLLESATGITKCDKHYYKVRQVLQSATSVITKCDVITKCGGTSLQTKNHSII